MSSDGIVPMIRHFWWCYNYQISFKFIDVSDFRTVPDHQEVWTGYLFFDVLICEILEYKKDIKDENSAQFFSTTWRRLTMHGRKA